MQQVVIAAWTVVGVFVHAAWGVYMDDEEPLV
jgi:hypothetical protein